MSATRGAVFPSQFKVQMLNAFVDTLREEGHWASVARGLSPEARDYGDNPRGPSSWFAGAIVLEMQVVAYELLGDARLRAVARRSVERSILQTARSITEGIFRLFGTSPAALLGRLGMFSKLTVRGVEQQYVALGDTHGAIEMHYPGASALPDALFVFTTGSMEPVFKLCGVDGAFDAPVVLNAERNRVRHAARWTARAQGR